MVQCRVGGIGSLPSYAFDVEVVDMVAKGMIIVFTFVFGFEVYAIVSVFATPV